jgi:hypothetical protein
MNSSPARMAVLAAKSMSRALFQPLPCSSLSSLRAFFLHPTPRPPQQPLMECHALRRSRGEGRGGVIHTGFGFCWLRGCFVEGGACSSRRAGVGSGRGVYRTFSSSIQHETPFLFLGRRFSSSSNRSAQHEFFSPDDLLPPPIGKISNRSGSRSEFKNQVQLDLLKKMELDALKASHHHDVPAAKALKKQLSEARAKTLLTFDDLRQVSLIRPSAIHCRHPLIFSMTLSPGRSQSRVRQRPSPRQTFLLRDSDFHHGGFQAGRTDNIHWCLPSSLQLHTPFIYNSISLLFTCRQDVRAWARLLTSRSCP